MTNSIIKNVLGLVAAASTTFVLFSAIASLADGDRAATVAAKQQPTKIAAR